MAPAGIHHAHLWRIELPRVKESEATSAGQWMRVRCVCYTESRSCTVKHRTVEYFWMNKLRKTELFPVLRTEWSTNAISCLGRANVCWVIFPFRPRDRLPFFYCPLLDRPTCICAAKCGRGDVHVVEITGETYTPGIALRRRYVRRVRIIDAYSANTSSGSLPQAGIINTWYYQNFWSIRTPMCSILFVL